MRCEWKEVELSEVADLTVGFVGTMASHYTENGILFLRSTHIEPFNIKMDDVRYISPEFNETIKKSSKKFSKENFQNNNKKGRYKH